MAEALRELFDAKTLMLVAVLGGGGTIGQYLGVTAPAKAEVQIVTPLVVEAQAQASQCLVEVSRLQKALAECQGRCGR